MMAALPSFQRRLEYLAASSTTPPKAGEIPAFAGMTRDLMDLTVIWAVIIAFAVAMYVVMDGFDLGIGILFPRLPVGPERDQAMNAIAPVWDGNETWLVLGGGGLMAAFPLAYAIVLPGALRAAHRHAARPRLPRRRLRVPLARSRATAAFWDAGFCLGSLVATFAQGITLGALLQGIDGRGPRLWRRLVGLADAVQPAHRRQPGHRLCPARRRLADLEDRRRAATRGPAASPPGCCRPSCSPSARSASPRPSSSTNISSAGSSGRACS